MEEEIHKMLGAYRNGKPSFAEFDMVASAPACR